MAALCKFTKYYAYDNEIGELSKLLQAQAVEVISERQSLLARENMVQSSSTTSDSRKARNRIAQRAFRERKKAKQDAQLMELQSLRTTNAEVDPLKAEVKSLQQELEVKRDLIHRLELDNADLHLRLGELAGTPVEPMEFDSGELPYLDMAPLHTSISSLDTQAHDNFASFSTAETPSLSFDRPPEDSTDAHAVVQYEFQDSGLPSLDMVPSVADKSPSANSGMIKALEELLAAQKGIQTALCRLQPGRDFIDATWDFGLPSNSNDTNTWDMFDSDVRRLSTNISVDWDSNSTHL